MDDFIFEQPAWERYISGLANGAVISAAGMLTLLEGEDDDAAAEALELLNQKEIRLDIFDIPAPVLSESADARLREECEFVKNGCRRENLPDTDPLRVYLDEIYDSACAEGEEKLLNEGKNPVLQSERFLAAGLPRAVSLAFTYVGKRVLLTDLVQEASIGLWNGIASCAGRDYLAYTDYTIRCALERTIFLQARSDGIGSRLRADMERYRTADRKLLRTLGRNPTLEEIADEMHIVPELAMSIRKSLNDVLLLRKTEEKQEPEENAENPDEEQNVEDTAYFQLRERISDLLSDLSEDDARLIRMRFGLDRSLPLSVEEIAEKLHMTREEVCRREENALARLRTAEQS